jgi:choline dehydrogenase-like flavoprotein
MFQDARELEDGATLEADIGIVGAGAAGITLARELAASRAEVVLIESGGLDFDPDTQDLYQGEIIGLDYVPLDAVQLRYFGGSTNHWNGRCRAFDPIDLEARAWVDGSGWPFGLGHLLPFYARAQDHLQLGRFGYTLEELGDTRPVLPLGESFVTRLAQRSPPTRMGEAYRDELQAAPRIRVVLHANAVAIETDSSGAVVEAVEVRTLEGRRLRLRARRFVLAMGGIEIPRLLLQPHPAWPEGIGNRHDVLGRYFADHPNLPFGRILFGTGHPAGGMFHADTVLGTGAQRFLALTPEIQRREGLPNCRLDLFPLDPWAESQGVGSLRALGRDLVRGNWPDDFLTHLGRVVRHVDEVASFGYERLTDPAPRLLGASFSCEPEPLASSRITLGDERDALGLRQPRLDWRLSDAFERSLDRVEALLVEALGVNGLGRFQPAPEREDPRAQIVGSFHPMGAARMHVDPARGVVDADARVHGTANLHLVGGAMLPTYGYGSPTLTIVALAVRLADHLAARLD